jgi:hypothetical protein
LDLGLAILGLAFILIFFEIDNKGFSLIWIFGFILVNDQFGLIHFWLWVKNYGLLLYLQPDLEIIFGHLSFQQNPDMTLKFGWDSTYDDRQDSKLRNSL